MQTAKTRGLLAQGLKENPCDQEAHLSVKKSLLKNNPYSSPEGDKSPIKNLPNELLTSIFQFGVNSQYEELEETNRNDELGWGDVGDDDDQGEGADEEQCDTASGSTGTETRKNDDDGGILDFQVVVSHVCRRWHSLAIFTPNLWTILSFTENLKIERTKEYILRSKSLPLTIDFFTTGFGNQQNSAQLSRFLDLIEPEVSRWRAFTYRRFPNTELQLLMSRLHEMPEARLLESFRILYSSGHEPHLFSTFSGSNCLPFHGHAPNLKEAVLWGARIDWDNALPCFLRGLRKLEITSLVDALRPSFATFVQMIKNSPELHTLALSFAGPNFPYHMNFHSHENLSSDFLSTIPSLRKLLLQSHYPPYVAAVVRCLDLPNLHTLGLNFLADCSGLIQTLSIPSHGRTQSLLQSITCLTIFSLPCTASSVELLLAQLVTLKTLQIDSLSLPGNTPIFEQLTMPAATGSGSSGSSDGIPCPKLEELVVSRWTGEKVTAVINARRNAGVPLKKIVIKKGVISVQDLRWIRKNVEYMTLR